MTWQSVTWTPDYLPALVALLQDSFGQRKTSDHVIWKHIEGPWGPSHGRLAIDDCGRLVGVRLLTPWKVRMGSKAGMILRAMDGAVSPRARRQGIFAGLVQQVLTEESTGEALAVVSTCVPASREAYRKLGWSILPAQASLVAAGGLTTSRIEDVDPATVLPSRHDGGLQTDWDTAALSWRTDPRSGYDYHAARLREAESPNGLVYRIDPRAARRLVVVLAVGSIRERRRLVAAAARRHKCPLVVHDGFLAKGDCSRRVHRSRSGSVLAVWTPRHDEAEPDPRRRDSWFWQGADLEGVL